MPHDAPPHARGQRAAQAPLRPAADAEGTAEEATQAGGEVRFGPQKMKEVGTLAVIKDPFGAVFAVIQPDPEMRDS